MNIAKAKHEMEGSSGSLEAIIKSIKDMRGKTKRTKEVWREEMAEEIKKSIVGKKRRVVWEMGRWTAFSEKKRRPWDPKFEHWKKKQEGADDISTSESSAEETDSDEDGHGSGIKPPAKFKF